jgi:hypothetical protein
MQYPPPLFFWQKFKLFQISRYEIELNEIPKRNTEKNRLGFYRICTSHFTGAGGGGGGHYLTMVCTENFVKHRSIPPQDPPPPPFQRPSAGCTPGPSYRPLPSLRRINYFHKINNQ